MNNKYYMQKALELAAGGKGRTSPNPMVGAVIVKGNRIIAEGYHKKAGTLHAEAVALKKAGPGARGATLYISLEPCCHTEKRTPPCTKAIIRSGIKKVIVAMTDPNPKVSGRGLKELRKAGIITMTGIMKPEAQKLNEAFIKHVTKKGPFVILKIAQTIDGKIATAGGESKWITGPGARQKVHQLRNEVDALLVGIDTVIKDNPSLDCRIRGGRDPFRVIVDGTLRIPVTSRVLGHDDGKTIIATTKKAVGRKTDSIINKGAKVLVIEEKDGKVDLNHLMKELGKIDIISVMIEGGSSVSASALSAGIVDRVMFFIAPKIIGGRDAVPSIGGTSPARLQDAIKIKDMHTSSYGEDILVEGYVDYASDVI